MLRFTIQHLSVTLGGMLGLELGEASARGLFCRVRDTGGSLPWCCGRSSLGLPCLKHRVRAHRGAPGEDPLVQTFFSIALQTTLPPTPQLFSQVLPNLFSPLEETAGGWLEGCQQGKGITRFAALAPESLPQLQPVLVGRPEQQDRQ